MDKFWEYVLGINLIFYFICILINLVFCNRLILTTKLWTKYREFLYQFKSVTQSYLTLCYPMDCRTPVFPVHHQLPDLVQIQCPSIWWCHPTISSSVISFSFCLQSFPILGSFQMSQLFASGGQSFGVSASASVLPINIQDCFLL